jgi:hypothetical protein
MNAESSVADYMSLILTQQIRFYVISMNGILVQKILIIPFVIMFEIAY